MYACTPLTTSKYSDMHTCGCEVVCLHVASVCVFVCVILLTHGLERGVLVEANSQVVMRVRQGHGWTQGRQGCVVQVVMI